MAKMALLGAQYGNAAALRQKDLVARAVLTRRSNTIKWVIRYTFYLFVFSLPFEEAYIVGGTTLSKFVGIALAGFALLQPRLCYKRPPKAFWWFTIYLFVFGLAALYLIAAQPNVPDLPQAIIQQFGRLVQLLVVFWISYNLLKQEGVLNGTLWALTVATVLLAVLQLVGVTSDVSREGRVTAFEANPNGIATVLSLGLLVLFGLGYGRRTQDWKGRLLFWLGCGLVALAMVQTGSRGVVVAVVGSLAFFFLRGKSIAMRLKFGVIALTGIVILVMASYQIEAVRVRWEETFYDKSLAGRERIYPAAIQMILERPLIGWGPVNHNWELGPRVGRTHRDEHNVYLALLAEVGLVGAIPFFVGLWLCGREAWRSRHGSQGILPFVMFLFLVIVSITGTIHVRKYYWVALSYALVAGCHMSQFPRWKTTSLPIYPGLVAARQGHRPRVAPATWRNRRRGRPS